eukprot:gb/GEZN01005151.1/.p1 GENE.gb/GEZN01005151.1/~~gb/GEZN01005151.1/.p1  ORF type:complete len:569 (+),score=83.65 gb/GEZN01005151.1/:50-1756(+)
MLSILLLISLSIIIVAEMIVIPPAGSESQAGFVLTARDDVQLSAYSFLALAIQQTLPDLTPWLILRNSDHILGLQDSISLGHSKFGTANKSLFLVSHSMGKSQLEVAKFVNSTHGRGVSGLILISGFLQRGYRPDVVSCAEKFSIQPQRTAEFPLGTLPDGVHDCYVANPIDRLSFPVRTLTIGGELDGVVRVSRIAEAFYTQVALSSSSPSNHPVVVVLGLNHGIFLSDPASPGNALPPSVATQDLQPEISPKQAQAILSELIAQFVAGGSPDSAGGVSTRQWLSPLLSGFVSQEASWFFTGADDEHGNASAWAAQAQFHMASPLPKNWQWADSTSRNHMLSDEPTIPPYYRDQHRARVTADQTALTLSGSTVAQLRYLELTVKEVDAGLNGWNIIKEETSNIVSLNDTGAEYVSALEIGTKMRSRQYVWNATEEDAPESLDDGNRCADINQAAYQWALDRVSSSTLARFQRYGKPMVMGPDILPYPPAGPWWIWGYLQYNETRTALTVSSVYTFYSLSANAYGAGTHYCKLLSPARALEWIYVDGLRGQYCSSCSKAQLTPSFSES